MRHVGKGFLCPVVLKRYSAEFSASGIILRTWSNGATEPARRCWQVYALGCAERAMKRGLVLIAGVPIAPSESFYARFNYVAEGEPFDENTVRHIKMTKRLA